MLQMIDTTNSDVMNTTESLTTDFTPSETDLPTEIGETITSLWAAHANARNTAKTTNAELGRIRAVLGERLSELKKLLASPGWDGQWSGFLRKSQIPRATADRLVSRHLRSLNPEANCISEEFSEATEEEIQRLFTSVWPRLRRTLRSEKSLHLVIDLLASRYQHGEQMDQGSPAVTPPTPIGLPSSDGNCIVESDLGLGLCSATAPISWKDLHAASRGKSRKIAIVSGVKHSFRSGGMIVAHHHCRQNARSRVLSRTACSLPF